MIHVGNSGTEAEGAIVVKKGVGVGRGEDEGVRDGDGEGIGLAVSKGNVKTLKEL